MQRTILDRDFRTWEVYATTGDYGFADPARLVFRCVSDRDEKARSAPFEGDKSDAESAVKELSESELEELLEAAEPVD